MGLEKHQFGEESWEKTEEEQAMRCPDQQWHFMCAHEEKNTIFHSICDMQNAKSTPNQALANYRKRSAGTFSVASGVNMSKQLWFSENSFLRKDEISIPIIYNSTHYQEKQYSINLLSLSVESF